MVLLYFKYLKFTEDTFLAKSKLNDKTKFIFYANIKDKTKHVKTGTQAPTHIFVINVSRTWLSSVIPKTSDIREYTWK